MAPPRRSRLQHLGKVIDVIEDVVSDKKGKGGGKSYIRNKWVMMGVTALVLITITLGSMGAAGHFKPKAKTTVTIDAPTKIVLNTTNKVENRNINTVQVLIPVKPQKKPKTDPARTARQQPNNQNILGE